MLDWLIVIPLYVNPPPANVHPIVVPEGVRTVMFAEFFVKVRPVVLEWVKMVVPDVTFPPTERPVPSNRLRVLPLLFVSMFAVSACELQSHMPVVMVSTAFWPALTNKSSTCWTVPPAPFWVMAKNDLPALFNDAVPVVLVKVTRAEVEAGV